MRTQMWKVGVVLLVVVSLLVSFEMLVPTTASAADPAQAKKPLVAFSQSCMTHPWRVTLTEDMKAWAEKLGIDLVWTDGQLDGAKQLKDCEDLLAKKPDVLVITPLQKDALSPVFDLAKKANVPLIVIDREINAEPGTGTFVSLITQSFVENGRIGGRQVAKALELKKGKPEGNVFYLDGTVGASPNIDQLKGFTEVMEKEFPGLKIVDRQDGGDVRGPSMKVIENALQRFPQGQIDAIYAVNEEEAFGAIDAIKEAGRTELLNMIVSKDGQTEELRRIVLGEIFGTSTCSPYYGEIALKTALAVVKGEKVEARQNIGIETYQYDTPENRVKTLDRYLWQVEKKVMY